MTKNVKSPQVLSKITLEIKRQELSMGTFPTAKPTLLLLQVTSLNVLATNTSLAQHR